YHACLVVALALEFALIARAAEPLELLWNRTGNPSRRNFPKPGETQLIERTDGVILRATWTTESNLMATAIRPSGQLLWESRLPATNALATNLYTELNRALLTAD